MYAFGNNKFGQLGVGSDEDELAPRVVEALRGKTIVQIECGEQYSIALTELGDVYTFGRGREGQLGLGHRESVSSPAKVEALAHEMVVKVAAGWQHAMALTSTNRLYTWGSLHRQWPMNRQL